MSPRRPLHPATPPWIARAVIFTLAAYWISRGVVTAARALETLLVVLAISFIAAAAFEVPVKWLTKYMRRGFATALLLGVTFLTILVLLAGAGVIISSQITSLSKHLPATFAKATILLNKHFHTHFSAKHLRHDVASWVSHVHLTHVASSSLGLLGSLLMSVLFIYYFVAEGPAMRDHLVSLVSAPHQSEVRRALELSIEKTGRFFFSRVVLSIIRFVLALAVLLLCHCPEPFALALFYALISEFIPIVGALVATALPAIVALSSSITDAIIVLVTLTVITLVRDYVLAPKLTRLTVKLHPILAFASVIAAVILFGPLAGLFAVPVLATITAFFSGYVHRHDLETPDTPTSSEPSPEPSAP
jgi:predicted PurR-regulated permease PerM